MKKMNNQRFESEREEKSIKHYAFLYSQKVSTIEETTFWLLPVTSTIKYLLGCFLEFLLYLHTKASIYLF